MEDSIGESLCLPHAQLYSVAHQQHNADVHVHPYFHTILQDCARDCLSERLKKEGKKTGVLKTSCRLRAFC